MSALYLLSGSNYGVQCGGRVNAMKENLELRARRMQPLFIPKATNGISTPVMVPLLMAEF